MAYAVGQWCPQTMGAWALPHEAADLLLAAHGCARGLGCSGSAWRSSCFPSNGARGRPARWEVEDIFQLAEVANASPHVYALWPHVASIMLRGQRDRARRPRTKRRAAGEATMADVRRDGTPQNARTIGVPGWDPTRGRLVIDTPYTQGMAGWFGGEPVMFPNLDVSSDNAFAVIVASSADAEPIASAGGCWSP